MTIILESSYLLIAWSILRLSWLAPSDDTFIQLKSGSSSAKLATLATLTPTPLRLPSHHHHHHLATLTQGGHHLSLPGSSLALPQQVSLPQVYQDRLQELVAAAPATLVPELSEHSVLQKEHPSWGGGEDGAACWRCPLQDCRLTAMCRCLRVIQACCKVSPVNKYNLKFPKNYIFSGYWAEQLICP